MPRPELPGIAASGDYLTTMDLIRAKARFALDNDCTMPIVEEGSSILLKNARHTLLAQTLRKEGKSVVPSIWYSPRKSTFSLSRGRMRAASRCASKLWAFCNT